MPAPHAGPSTVDIEAAPVAAAAADTSSPPAANHAQETGASQKRKSKPEPELPECVKALQRCAARVDEWERKQATIARQREYQTSPPDKPEPLLQRFITVPIVALILTWVAIVYLWRIIYPALSDRPNALASQSEGVGLCVGFCVLYVMTIWSWITVVIKQPGYGKDFLPQVEPPLPTGGEGQGAPGQAFDPSRRSFQEPILYNGPVAPAPAPAGDDMAGETGTSGPPGILSSALPIAIGPHGNDKSASQANGDDAQAVLSTSARSGAGTDRTAVSHSAAFPKPAAADDYPIELEAERGTDKFGDREAAVLGAEAGGAPSSPHLSQRTRSASIASSLTGLPPSPRPEAVDGLPGLTPETLALGSVGQQQDQHLSPQQGGQRSGAPPPPPIRASDESSLDVMPGGLPAHAREYNWQSAPQHPNQSQGSTTNDNNGPNQIPIGPPGFLPIPQRYPKVVPLLAPAEEVPSRYCHWCKIIKPPRAHHCKKCGQCVLKMDHHCPWVGGCVGALNYRFFLIFVMWVSLLEVFVLISNAILFSRGVRKSRNALELLSEQRWTLDGYMISLFPICAIYGIFTLTLMSVHLYLIAFNLSTIEQLAYSSRTHGEDAVLDGWMRQTLDKRRKALEEFDRAGGWQAMARRNRASTQTAQGLPLPAVATSDRSVEKEAARLKKKAEELLLVRSDYVSCGLFLPHKALLRQLFLDGGPWGAERTEGNPWWLGGSAEHGAGWERLVAAWEDRETRLNEMQGAEGPISTSKEDREGQKLRKDPAMIETETRIRKLQRHTRGRPSLLGSALENAKQVYGPRPWEWFLPVGKPAYDGLSFPLNPRYAVNGARRPREQWPAPLQ